MRINFFVFIILISVSVWAQEDYRIGPEDVLEINVWRYPELQRTIPVGPDGKISLPLTDEIVASGFTRKELTEKISKEISQFISDPKVFIIIKEYHSQKVYVLGEVKSPGVVELKSSLNLLETISKAGGLTENANYKRCSIIRDSNKIIEINLRELLIGGNKTLNVPILNGDTVYVGDNTENQVYVLGEVKNPGVYTIRGNWTIMDAIANAGGPTDDTYLKNVRLVRGGGPEPEITMINLQSRMMEGLPHDNIDVQPKDIVFLSKTTIAKFNYILEQIIPSLRTIILTDQAGGVLEGNTK